MVDIIGTDETRKYYLAEGTPDEVWLELPERKMLMGHKQWFGQILALNLAFSRGQAPHAAPLIPTIQAIFVLWQYVAFDIARLRERNDDLEAKNRDLLARLDTIARRVTALEAHATPPEPQPSTPSTPQEP